MIKKKKGHIHFWYWAILIVTVTVVGKYYLEIFSANEVTTKMAIAKSQLTPIAESFNQRGIEALQTLAVIDKIDLANTSLYTKKEPQPTAQPRDRELMEQDEPVVTYPEVNLLELGQDSKEASSSQSAL